MSTETIVFVSDELSEHRFPDGHPVSSIDRQEAFWSEAVVRGLDKRVVIDVPRLATSEELERFHTPDYVSWVKLRSKIGVPESSVLSKTFPCQSGSSNAGGAEARVEKDSSSVTVSPSSSVAVKRRV